MNIEHIPGGVVCTYVTRDGVRHTMYYPAATTYQAVVQFMNYLLTI